MNCHVTYWYDSHSELHRLGQWLYDRGDINHVEDLIAIIDEPWHWERERALMLNELALEEGTRGAVRA